MTKTLVTLLFFALSFSTYSQTKPPVIQQKLDSLWGVWKDTSKEDQARLEAIQWYLETSYRFTHPDSIFYYAQLEYDFAKEKDNKLYMLFALDSQARSYWMKGNYPMALEILKQKVVTLENDYEDKKMLAQTLNNIGMLSLNQSNYPEALNYLLKSLKVAEEVDFKAIVAANLSLIGNIYNYQDENNKALEYFLKGLEIAKESGDKMTIAQLQTSIGDTYRTIHDYSKATEYLQEALAIRKDIGDANGYGIALGALGSVYFQQERYAEALPYYQECFEIFEGTEDKRSLILAYRGKGTTYNQLGNYQKAIENCKNGLELAEEIGDVKEQETTCNCLYNAYKGLGNCSESLNYYEQMHVAQDSLQSKNTIKKLQQMEFDKRMLQDSIATAEKERKIEEAHQLEVSEKDRNKNLALAAGLFFLLVSGGVYSRYHYTKKAKAVIEKEKDRSENLLLNILPAEVAEELKLKGEAEARDYDMVSILFTDFKSFTKQSEKLTAAQLVKEINNCFTVFDTICEKYRVEKIKTIGDAYMAAGGLPVPEDNSIKNTVLAALEMQDFMVKQHQEKETKGEDAFEMRVGIHTGPVVAGIVGVKKFQYDIWGDTVNTASRIESNGEVGKVNVSETTYNYLKDDPAFVFESRGKVEAKGKGEIQMYFVSLA